MADVANSRLLENIEGIHSLKDALFVLVKTEWNAHIVNELERGCVQVLEEAGAKIMTFTVPGAVEIPFAIKLFSTQFVSPAAYIALGAVVRGDTPHFDYVCRSVTDGITSLNLSLSTPVVFGVLTVDNEAQAQERIGGKHGHKGAEAAITALKMAALSKKITERKY